MRRGYCAGIARGLFLLHGVRGKSMRLQLHFKHSDHAVDAAVRRLDATLLDARGLPGLWVSRALNSRR